MRSANTTNDRVGDVIQGFYCVDDAGVNSFSRHAENHATRFVLRDGEAAAGFEKAKTCGPIGSHSGEDSRDGSPRKIESRGTEEIVHGGLAVVLRGILDDSHYNFPVRPGGQFHLHSARSDISAVA